MQVKRTMGKFVFVTNHYLPNPGATGLCVHTVASCLAERGHDVTTVCFQEAGRDITEIDGVHIIGVEPPRFLTTETGVDEWKRRLHHFQSLCSRVTHLKSYPLRSNGLVKKYMAEILKCVGNENAVIMASFVPLEAVYAVSRVKEQLRAQVKTVYYSSDTLSNEQGNDGILPQDYRMKCGVQWEKRLFALYDKIMIMECHKEHYFTDIYYEFQDKMELANFPLLRKPSSGVGIVEDKNKQMTKGKKKLTFVYAGTLYKNLRNPQYLCSVLTHLTARGNIEVFFLGGGDCADIMEHAVKDSGEKIQYFGMRPHEEALRYLERADVLLSIGNIESPMAPSKIYEYMATGKPIIHTYTYEKDPCLEPLQKYGNALLIKENDPEAVAKIEFFLKHAGKLDYKTVEKRFATNTPQYTADILENLCRENLIR